MKPQYSCVRSSLRFRLPGMVITVLCPLGTSCTLKHQHTLLEEERFAMEILQDAAVNTLTFSECTVSLAYDT